MFFVMKVARYLTACSLFGILLSGWILWNAHLLIPNLGRILALLGAVGVLAALTSFVVYSIVMLIKSSYGKGIGWIVILFGLILIALPMAILISTNWWVGPSFRSMLGLSASLPNDNLFVAGGWVAHTSVALIILLCVSILLSIKPIIMAIGTFSFRWSNGSNDANKVDEVPPQSVSLDDVLS